MLTAARNAPPIDWTQPVSGLRATADAGVRSAARMVAAPAVPVTVKSTAAVAGGQAVPLRIYRSVDAHDGRAAALMFLHGGGWWMGSLETADELCRDLAAVSGAVIVSVGYRLAPEHPFPAALDDGYAALEWISRHAAAWGIDPEAVSIAGESAGANLAAAICLRARDQGGPRIVAQWLDVPALDLTVPDSASLRRFGTGFGLDSDGIKQCVRWYAGDHDRSDPYLSPLLASNLDGLPPAVVTAAECDPLRDQAEEFTQRLSHAGVTVRYRYAPGLIHGTTWLTGLLAEARRGQAFAIAALDDYLRDPVPPKLSPVISPLPSQI
ncbi:alpha/beta hydrolase [Paractinoplanes ovalisporus]|nr:alpha/beta hydrolase [Actinoplanes ovalisporus]